MFISLNPPERKTFFEETLFELDKLSRIYITFVSINAGYTLEAAIDLPTVALLDVLRLRMEHQEHMLMLINQDQTESELILVVLGTNNSVGLCTKVES